MRSPSCMIRVHRPSLQHPSQRFGFTLIEILVVIGIIGVLSSITLVAINPAKQLCDARDAKRISYTKELRSALYQYIIEEWTKASEDMPLGAENALPVCREGISDPSCVNLDALLPDYIVSLPVDPEETDANLTGYSVYEDNYGRPMIVALYIGQCSSEGGEGEGEEGGGECAPGGDPIVICDCTGLQYMQADLTADYELGQSIDCSETTTWNSGAGFEPIGDEFTRYTGIFDGAGYVISDLTVDRPGEDNIGLFGYIDGSTITDVGLQNVYLVGNLYVGGITAYNNGGTIENSFTTGTIRGDYYELGGLVGHQEAGSILNSHSTIDISGIDEDSSTYYVGGLVGYFDGGSITDSYAIYNLEAYGYVGGLVGILSSGATLSNSFATGDITLIGPTPNDYGGLVGYKIGSISSSYWNNHAHNPVNCYYGGNNDCTAIDDDSAYFYDPANEPLASWDFVTIWQGNSPTGYPSLR